MKILNKIIIKDLKLNKKRSIVTIIGIMLSVALICAVAGMFTSFRATLVKGVIESSGYYHVKIEDVDDSIKSSLKHNYDVKDIYEVNEIGYAKLEKINYSSKPYIHLYSINNNDFNNLKFKLIEGRFPNNENEIIISNYLKTLGEMDYKIGDTIELNVGNRMSDGYKLNPSNPYYEDEENIENARTMKFTIVGIIERPDYTFERYSDPGFTALTTNLEGSNTNLYISFKHPREYKKSISEILDIKENMVDVCSSDYTKECNLKYNYVINDDLLRWEIFNFGDTTTSMLIKVVSIVILIIMGTSIFVIRNAFAISTTEKTKMIGMLKSIGATKKQIKKSIVTEGMILGIIAIPLGILSGILADYILVIIVNLLVGDFMFGDMNGMVFKVSFIAILVSIILGFITIYLSSLASTKKASKISPIESIRGSNNYNIKAKKLRTPFIIKKLFKTGGVVAYKNLKRSSKKYRTTVISLVVSILVFITMNTFINYGFSLSNMYYTDIDYNIMIYSYEEKDVSKILSLDNIQKYTKLSNGKTIIIDKKYLSKLGEEVAGKYIDDVTIMIYVFDETSFKNYIEKLNLKYEDYKDKVIFNDYFLYSTDEGRKYDRFLTYNTNDTITGTIENDNINIKIDYITSISPDGTENFYVDGGMIFVSENYYKEHIGGNLIPQSITIKSNNAEQFEKDFNNLKLNANLTNIEQMMKQNKSMILVISIFLYGFITVITLIGVTNIFNTITTNMELRQKEFAMLKSIGMTKKEFNRMINLETLFYSTKSLVIGIVLGILGSFGIYKAFATAFDNGFKIPLVPIVISIIAVFILVFFIMRFSLKKINKQNIIETIRNDNI